MSFFQPVHHKVFPHLDHLQILRDPTAAEYVKGIVASLLKEKTKEGSRKKYRVTDEDKDEAVPNIEIVP